MRSTYRPLLAGLLLAAVLGLPAGARAQFRYGATPAAGYDYAQTQAVANAAAVNRASSFRYAPVAGWGNTIVAPDPYGGFLSGAADVMAASGQYEISHQQANLTREQVKSAHLDNRRRSFDEARYEKENTPPPSAVAEEYRREQVAQVRTGAPLSEIWAGTALNVLLTDIRQYQNLQGLQGANIPLDPEVVKHISLTTGSNTGSSTMFNNGGKLKWPPELDDPRFDAERKNIDKLFLQATQEAAGPDGLSGRTQRELNAALDKLKGSIDTAVDAMTPSDNIRAMSYANQLTASSKMLRDPTIANQLSGRWAPRGDNVAELVANMNRDGLKFGPAGPDSKPYYTSLYQSLVQYDSSLMARSSRYAASPGNKP
jgi:hypothetical protein